MFTIAPEGKRPRLWAKQPGDAYDLMPSWSPDGRSVVVWRMPFDSGPGGLVVYRHGRRPQVIPDLGGTASFSPDGTALLASANETEGRKLGRLLIVDLRGGKRRVVLSSRREFFSEPVWSADGRWIVFVSSRTNPVETQTIGDARLERIHPDGSGRARLLPGARGTVHPDVSPDGSSVVFVWNFGIWTVPLRGGEPRAVVGPVPPGSEDLVSWARLSPDGLSLVWEQEATISDDTVTVMRRRGLSPSPASTMVGPDLLEHGAIYDINSIGLTPSWQPRCSIYGTPGNDVLRGTPGPDVICGLGGDDRIDGRGGNDVIQGGDGDDTLIGGPGMDWLFGGHADDRIQARDGQRDIADGGPGSNTVQADRLDTRRR